ncbi:MAG: DUF354 domain-containing protein [Clostridia bacterium]|nr:DUF354 domain-containing protein [Clostridia bacterium]
MRIAIDINHPAHVHFFKNFIWEMEKKGHRVFITASEKDVAIDLLNAYGFSFVNLRSYGHTLFEKIINIPVTTLKGYSAVRDFRPDFFLGFGSVRAAHISWLMGKPCVIFDDDEYTYPYYLRFVSTICAFSGFKLSGKKVIKIPGYKELAYLHPKWFRPTPLFHTEESVTLMRFVSWTAFHDVGKGGFSLGQKKRLDKELEKYSKVFISSEAPLPADLEKYRLTINPEDMHSFLSTVNLLVCDSQTMATEGAVLGIPVVRCNSFVGDNDMGNFMELEKRYNLIFNYRDPELALAKAVELIKTPGLRRDWNEKRNLLLKEKIDVTSFMVWLVENYPDSVHKIKAADTVEEWHRAATNTPKAVEL